MQIRVHFYAHCREITGMAESLETMASGSRVEELRGKIFGRFPKLAAMGNSIRVAVGVDYQNGDYILREGEEVSFLPPMQGG